MRFDPAACAAGSAVWATIAARAEVWGYNAYVLPPTVTFYLEDEPEVIQARQRSRVELSRLELTGSPGRELVLYREASTFLQTYDWEQVTIDCRGRTPERVIAAILKRLDRYAN